MTLYEYRCTHCSTAYSDFERANRIERYCNKCEGTTTWQRVWAVSIHRPMQEHFNHSVGKPISDPRQHADELKRASEAATLATGIEHNYVPIDYADARPKDFDMHQAAAAEAAR